MNATRTGWLLTGLSAMTIQCAMAEELTGATHALLDALDDGQRAVVMHALDDDERYDWHFIPKSSRKGLSIRDMSAAQAQLTHDLLQVALSESGYRKSTDIMRLEGILGELEFARGRENAREFRDPKKYYVSVFGEPQPGGSWALSFEGHHLSLNFTVVEGAVVASSPAFMAANPHRVGEGPHVGLRVLGAEEDRARAVLGALDEEQRERAMISPTAPPDILTEARRHVSPSDPQGLPASAMSAAQRQLLRELIETYASNVTGAAASERQAQVDAAGTDIWFAWMGSSVPGEPHYYRVQTATFLIEYDNIQNGANHSHTVWRDYDGDFGRDVISEHRAAHVHGF